ncbi:MAG: DegT/DnrJ/EryC1/StrS family aminotransferase [Anaerolineaceae bacterium]|jgi:dTDP-4-amino-4,6-dideoxygalactose transaminase|nr:DegT/DnrJ/EryC1/StrS family aminotransferase [Anaerolineaceae bacterium]MDD4042256.1 DegT/DnrJ/EryC1/StrS family aminotransferase [Anaerolineaceae bacterium]MDD4578067.1 DegT/DnrJ/EryC1/StrS family aminotransferase [Anaerolineaceae bacterium]
MNWRVTLADVNLGIEEETAVLDVLHSGWLTMGAVTQAFEQEFAAFVGAKHAIAVNNATAALHLACMAVGLGPEDEALIPSLTFVATANAVRYTGAKVVFADIESEDWLCICPHSIEELITEKTKAIVVMHYAGFACDMPAIMRIAKEHGLAVIEDAAHAVGASLEGRALGTWGDVGCYSFFGNKNMTTAEGGMLVTDDDLLAEKIRIMRSHGMTTLTWDRYKGHASTYDVVELGYNYRLDEIRSAIGREQLKKLPAGNARRAQLVSRYREDLARRCPQLKLPFGEGRGGVSSQHIFPILLPEGVEKEIFRELLKQDGIQTSFHYPPVHSFEIYRNPSQDFANTLWMTENVANREVTLPLYPTMSDEQQQLVIESVYKALTT